MIKKENVVRVLEDIFDGSNNIYLEKDSILCVEFLLPFNFSDGIHLRRVTTPHNNIMGAKLDNQIIFYESEFAALPENVYRLDIDDISVKIDIICENMEDLKKMIENQLISEHREEKIKSLFKEK